jgi:CubicO group peptidase (beta-lactamase class C family)
MKLKIITTIGLILFMIRLSFPQTTEKLNQVIDSLFSEYDKPKTPGANVMVIQNGNIIFDKSYGLSDLENSIRAARNTNYRLASVTKQFTTAAVLMFIEENKISFNTRLTEVFDSFPKYGGKINIYHLLTHTSGLIDYESLIPDTATEQVHDIDVLHMMMKLDSTYFEPGIEYRYSNTGYAILALVVEKVAGKTFAEFLKERIFIPLGMNSTVAYEKDISMVENRAFGYSRKEGDFIFDDQSLTSAVLGDGGIYSSTADLFKWDQSLYTEKLISSELMSQAFSPAQLVNGEKINYGFGWHLEEVKGFHSVYHTGSTRGFRNVIQRIPEKKLTVIILTNRNEGEPKEIGEKIIDFMFNNLEMK